ncbi:hypothetical protein ACHAXR_012320 [Thalassiosira sp. AJA248-18]
MSAVDVSQCAACGKGGDGLKACTACKLVKYCNVTCQKAHRPKHKKECKKRASEIFDEALFKTPPPRDDCPICFLPLSLNDQYQVCCGKTVCVGCIYGDMMARSSLDFDCPFCRTPATTSENGLLEGTKKRVEAGDVNAMLKLGCQYYKGHSGLPQDYNKALELWHRAAKLGCAKSHYSIANAYAQGVGVEKDMKKAKHHWELGAIGGDDTPRYNLGVIEVNAGNTNRAMKHFMIAAEFGCDDSLKEIQRGFSDGHVTKDDFEKALRAHKEFKDEVQSDQRDAVDAVRRIL